MASKIEVSCPCCYQPLYSHDRDDGGLIGEDSPHVRRDAQGWYLRCPHCAMRIAAHLKENSPRGFQLDPHQKCDVRVAEERGSAAR